MAPLGTKNRLHAPCPNGPMVDLKKEVLCPVVSQEPFESLGFHPEKHHWEALDLLWWWTTAWKNKNKNNQKHNSSWVTRLATRPKLSPRPLATPSTLEVGMRVQATNLGNTIAGSRSATINLADLWGLLPDMNLIIYHIYSALMWWFWGNQLWATSRNKTNKWKPNIAQHSPTSI